MRTGLIFILLLLLNLSYQKPAKVDTDKPYAELKSLPVGSITPTGWLKEFLVRQRDGITGHLEVGGYPFNTTLWIPPYNSPYSNDTWRYEQTAYWIDGMARCGYLLNDSMLIGKSGRQIDYVFTHPDKNGYLGPDFGEKSKMSRWPHTVFFRAAMARYEKTKDPKIIEGMRKHYLSERYSHNQYREVTNVEPILFCYGKTGDTALLNFAKQIYDNWVKRDKTDGAPSNFVIDKPATEHGVTYNEQAKLGAIMYMYTGDKKYLETTRAAYNKIFKYHMLADAMHSCTEGFQPVGPLESHEACDITDFTWGLEYMTQATGQSGYADVVEKVIFNALPGTIMNDFKALQYFSSPNQVIATSFSNHNAFYKGSTSMRFSPNPWTQCCAGNINRAMPNYIINMWMSDKNGNLAAVLYGPSILNYQMPEGEKVEIKEETNYPFDDNIKFRINTSQKKKFTLSFRIPDWTAEYHVTVNGKEVNPVMKDGFAVIEKTWSKGDFVDLKLVQTIKKVNWGNNEVSIERGPIVYALNVKQTKLINKTDTLSSAKFPAWELYPASAWNYALALDKAYVSKLKATLTKTSYPWDDKKFPVKIKVPAVKLKDWKLVRYTEIPAQVKQDSGNTIRWRKELKEKGFIEMTPKLPTEQELNSMEKGKPEYIELVPFGCAKLRVTVFDNIKK